MRRWRDEYPESDDYQPNRTRWPGKRTGTMPPGGESTGIPGKRSLTEELRGPTVARARAPYPLLVDEDPEPHQMSKADFVGQLEPSLREFARTLSPAGCPLLDRYLAHYHAASAGHCELVIHRWVPDWRDAVDAPALLERVLRHAKRAMQDWRTRGVVPPELDRGGAIRIDTNGRASDGDGASLDQRSARGLASADSILLREDASFETLAHELVHQEQAQLPVEQDRGRDAAELEAASLAREAASTGTRNEARYALDLSAAAADSDAKDAKPASRLSGRPFAVEGDASNPRIYVSSGWIASQGVPRGHVGEITGRTHPGVFRPLLEAVLPLYPYATQRGIDPFSSIPRLTLRISDELWKTGEQDLGIGRTLFLTLGLPPTQSVQVFPTNDGIEIYADTAYTYPADGDDARRIQARQALVMLAADGVEKRLGVKLERAMRSRLEGELDQIFAHQDDKVVRATISMEVLAEFFGPETLREYANATPTEGGGVIVIGGEALLILARDEAERQKVVELLAEIFGEAKPAAPGTEGQVILPLDIEALLAFDKDPRRKELLEILRAQRQDPSRDENSWNATQVRDALANARETLEIRDANKKLGREPDHTEGARDGLLPYPVPGAIVNLSDHINLGMRAEFEFRSTGTNDPREWRFADSWFFHQPEADIDWYAVEVDAAGQPKGAPEKHERIHYREAKPDRWGNDRRFEHQFKRAGLYEIHAYVSHSMFQPAHYQDTVEILTEEERLGRFEHERSERWGVETHRKEKVFRGMDFYRRDGVSDDEDLERQRDQDAHAYARGTRAEGRLADETANDPEGGANQEVDRLEHEIEELEELEAQYPGDDRRSRSMREYAEERRERLESSVERVKAGLGDREARPVQVQGNFASRTHGVSSGPLNLVAFFRRQGSAYAGELLDHSELVRSGSVERPRSSSR